MTRSRLRKQTLPIDVGAKRPPEKPEVYPTSPKYPRCALTFHSTHSEGVSVCL